MGARAQWDMEITLIVTELTSDQLKLYADTGNIVLPKKTRTNRFARKGANLFCSTLESALSRFQSRNVSS